jgi:membrane dipeptidase
VSNEFLKHEAAREAEQARLRFLTPGDSLGVVAKMKAWQDEHPAPRATLAQLADHIDHIRRVAGIDHVGIGSDFDGIKSTPAGLEDVSCYPALLAELLRRGYSAEDVRKVAGLNALRVLRGAEQVAERLQAQQSPSGARLEDLDARR